MQSREWEEIQTRTFTRWVNAQLAKRGSKVENLFTDFEDGIKLVQLYEVISDEKLGGVNNAPKLRIQKIQNLNRVISEINKFVESVGVKVQFSAEQVNSGEKRTILGMIWCLIHKFEIQDISEEEFSAREGLLLWCQKKTKGYKNVNVRNFNTSWQDGLAFCALIHKHRPDLLDFDSLEKANAKENLQLAFDTAEKHLDIPQLLDVDDMVSYKPDDKSVMTYIAYYWKKFAASNKEQKAARKVAKVAKNQRENAEIAHDYEERAKKLKEWIAEYDEKLKDTSNFGNNLEQVQSKAKDFNDFKKNLKPKQSIEKADLALMLTNLQNKQKNERVPIYEPPEELSTKAIQEVWDELENKQKIYDAALREAIKRMKYIEMCLARFRSRSKKVIAWQEEKEQFLNQEVPETETLAKLRALVKMMEAFEEEKKSVKATLDSTTELGTEIIASGHSASDEVASTMEKMKLNDDNVTQLATQRTEKLVALLKFKQEIEDNCIQFAKRGEELSIFLEDADLVLTEPVKASNVKDVEDAQEIVAKLVETHKINASLEEELVALDKKIKDAGADPYIYSRHKLADLVDKYTSIGERLAQRTEELQKEHVTQQENAELLNKFSEACDNYEKITDEQFQAINQILEGEPEDQLKVMQELSTKANEVVDAQMEELRKLYQQLEENDIAELSRKTIQELEVLAQQVKSAVSKRIQAIEQDIYAKKMSSVSEEQLKEFHDTFRHFDKNNNNKLNKNEFKACCASIGEDIPDEELDAFFQKYDIDGDGYISFEEYVQFMIQVAKEGTSYEDVIESFKALAGGADFITEAQLYANMDKEDADYLKSVMPAVDGGYDYVAYAKQTYGVE